MFFKSYITKLAISLALAGMTFTAQAEQVMVDKAEYENLKKAVESLMKQQQEAMEAATRAEEKASEAEAMAEEANEVATATAEVVEDSPMDAFEGLSIGYGTGFRYYRKKYGTPAAERNP